MEEINTKQKTINIVKYLADNVTKDSDLIRKVEKLKKVYNFQAKKYQELNKKIKIEVKSNSETNVDVNIYMFTKEDFNNAIKNALNSSNFRETLDKEIDNLKYEDKHTLNTEITFQELRKMWKPLFIKKYSDDLETIVFYSIFNIKPE